MTPSLDTLTVSYETALALGAAGWDRPTVLVWAQPAASGATGQVLGPPVVQVRGRQRQSDPAPTLGELLDALPPFAHGGDAKGEAHGAFWLHADRYDPAWRAGDPPAGVRLYYRDHDGRVLYLRAVDDHAVQYDADCERNPAEAAGRLWLALHAAGHIPPKP